MRAWLLFILLLVLAGLVWASGWRPPDRYNPWASLDLKARPDMFLRYKLQRLDSDPAVCRAAIRDAGVVFKRLADHEEANGCGWTNAERVSAIGEARFASPVILSCPLTASMVLFDRQVLQPQAQAAFDSPIRVIEHVGSYACRNIYHRDQAPLSAHARADAIDLTGFPSPTVAISPSSTAGTTLERGLSCTRCRMKDAAISGPCSAPITTPRIAPTSMPKAVVLDTVASCALLAGCSAGHHAACLC